MNSIRYEGVIPAKLKIVCDCNRHKIKEVTYHDGWATDTGYSYEVVLRNGWRASDDLVHTLLDTSVDGIIRQIKAAERCDCDNCLGR